MTNSLVPTQPQSPNLPPRQPVDPLDLTQWIDQELTTQMVARNTFTAFGITKLLRAKYPQYEIIHVEVRTVVHTLMQQVQDYSMSVQNWNGEDARTFEPIQALPAAPSAKPQAAAAPKQIPGSVKINWDE